MHIVMQRLGAFSISFGTWSKAAICIAAKLYGNIAFEKFNFSSLQSQKNLLFEMSLH